MFKFLFGGMVGNYGGLVNKGFFLRITLYLTMSTILLLASSSITLSSEVFFLNFNGLFKSYFHVWYLVYVDINSFLFGLFVL